MHKVTAVQTVQDVAKCMLDTMDNYIGGAGQPRSPTATLTERERKHQLIVGSRAPTLAARVAGRTRRAGGPPLGNLA